MDEAEARVRLEMMVDASSEPVLEAEDMDLLLSAAKRPDAAGVPPSDEDWTPTWDLDAAAVRGWELKMARVATRFDFNTDGQQFKRSQMLDHFETMADVHRRRGLVSVPTPRQDTP